MIVGIDLGTTNSLVAAVKDGVPHTLTEPQALAALLPSVVHFPENDGPPVVGSDALPFLATAPGRTIYSAKRLMGKGAGDAPGLRDGLAYALTDDARIDLGDGRIVSAPEVAAYVLRALKTRAEAALGVPVEKAVVTVPAYFNDAQRQATKDAGEAAGLEIVRIVNEPTAASLAYGLQNKKDATIAVYDLGGGTFDISLLRLEDGVFEVLATGGDTRLGGDDFDAALVAWAKDEPGDALDLSTLRTDAEAAKRALSTAKTATIQGREISRAAFDTLIAPFVDRTIALCKQALADAKLSPGQIDEVVLVGGSTRVPAARAAVGAFFGKTPHTDLNPDEVVALGAALQADILSGNRDDLLLLDVTPLSLGIETMGGAVERLIFRNARIPCSASESFTTSLDGQGAVLLHIVQGEREMAADCRSLARLELTGIPPMPAGIPKVDVKFLLDANGILSVSAIEIRSGIATNVRIKPTYGIDQTQVRQMVRASFLHADEDYAVRMRADMVNEANAAIVGAQKLLRGYGEELLEKDRSRIESSLAALIAARDSAPDHSIIRAAIDELDRLGAPLAEAAMSSVARDLVGGKTLAEAVQSLEDRKKDDADLASG